MKRRTLIRSLLAGGAFLGNPWGPLPLLSAAADATRFYNRLAIPPLYSGKQKDGVRTFELTARQNRTDFWPGSGTPTLGFNDQTYLGPTLKMVRGESVEFRVRNLIGEPTAVHWHGMHLPAVMDGGPHQEIANGGRWTARFSIHQPAATLWYHSHQMHQTGPQVYGGMAGLILISDKHAEALSLPNIYGEDDIPLVLQDRDFARDGRLIYVRHMHDVMRGKRGRNILVNGTLAPYIEVPPRQIRFRILNGSNARTFTLGFPDNRSFLAIASDGGFLSRPVSLQRLRLSPGERAEILVDCSTGEDLILRSYPEEFFIGRQRVRGFDTFDLLQLRVKGRGKPRGVPARLLEMPPLPPQELLPVRRFTLQMAMGMRMMRGEGFTINGKVMNLHRIDERVPVDTWERWEIDNRSNMPHPFHIHNVQFRITDRNGLTPPAHEQGWKDTVLVDPGERVGLLLRFERYTNPSLPYMYHCHILEHEDRGMMGQFTVEQEKNRT